ncbi:hypothetical protein IQ268_04135 [Oculatella sp. LEGE 06141]|uniref:hypothetical protein n=1 Tax=Oculatella sp. LEGE 06141 TaxID=1828648 RepID=UPI0018812F36|nr:hypothetical protein [Oculatella sp. LEGE 06141]MBE9177769.1 hypothetical protein [Oculatella sp. LEGE 06141]
MLVKRWHLLFIPATDTVPKRHLIFWFSLSLTFAAVFGIMGLQQAFSDTYVVQDDARQHVFWMQRFLDPTLFPNDLIADYFQSIAPSGYRAIYGLAASIGINPMLFNKLLPILLTLATTVFCFGLCLELLAVPFAGFVGSLLLNQNLWLHDDVVSGTARGFMYPIFLAFLYFLLRREAKPFLWKSLIPCLVTIALQGLFYPHYVFIMSGTLILRLLVWNGRLQLSSDRRDYLLCILGLAVACGVMLPYALDVSEYGGPLSVSLARTMPEFYKGGRSDFFDPDVWQFWLSGKRSGALIWVMPLCLVAPALLLAELKWRDRFPLIGRSRHLVVLVQVELVSLAMFFAAHAVLFRLYLPARYSQNSLIILTALAAAVAVPVGLDALFRWAEQPQLSRTRLRRSSAIAAAILLSALLLLSPIAYQFPNTRYKSGDFPGLYRFFANQPKDTLIAALSSEADDIPSFAQRSVLVTREHSVPYQMGYYGQLRQRITEQLQAEYSPDLAEVQRFIQAYGIDFWLIDRAYLRTPAPRKGGDRLLNEWVRQFQPVYDQAVQSVARGNTPALTRLVDRCTRFKNKKLVVLNTSCIMEASAKQADKADQES